MSNELLLRLFRSEFFNSWIAVSYLFRYSGNLGIQHYLCSELNTFPLSEIEFFLPQLVHLFITRPSDSVALECFLVDLCEKSTHMAIMTLWYLQAYVSDLSANPNSPSFALCRRLLNKCQTIVFSDGNAEDLELADAASSMNLGLSTHKVHENALPALVGIGAMLTAFAQPLMTKSAGQIAIAQGRRNSITSSSSAPRRNTLNGVGSSASDQESATVIHPTDEELLNNSHDNDDWKSNSKRQSTASASTILQQHSSHDMPFQSSSQPELPISKRRISQFNPFTSSPSLEDLHHGKAFAMSRYLKSAQNKFNRKMQLRTSTSSLNDKSSSSRKSSSKTNLSIFDPALTALGQSSVPTNSTTPLSPALTHCSSDNTMHGNKHSHLARHRYISSSLDSPSAFDLSDDDADHDNKDISDQQSIETSSTFTTDDSKSDSENRPSEQHTSKSAHSGDDSNSDSDDDGYQTLSRLDTDHRKLLLKSNYFRSEIQFLLALVDIATRLVIVPKPARMSALHAELALLNHNLPAEVCLPLWCPATTDKPYHHRVVRINPSDAVVLNSAERAPYLLMIEVLEDEMSFDDDYMSTMYRMRRHHHRTSATRKPPASADNKNRHVDDDIGSFKISKEKKKGRKKKHHSHKNGNPSTAPATTTTTTSVVDMPVVDMGECLGGTAAATLTARTSISNDGGPASSLSPHPSSSSTRLSSMDHFNNKRRPSSPSLDDHAERMRTAAVMLAQLQQNTSTATAAAGAATAAVGATGEPLTKTLLSSTAQQRQGTEQIRQKIIKEMLALEDQRMEKMKKEGATNGGDGEGSEQRLEDERYVAQVVNKEDPSAAVFSEDWEVKKARIRASSPYGHLPNWRLLSVIVKQGADLRQEQFAIQLIREMQRIWQDTGVDVWVKYFRVLVTSDGSGLIETLRNTISVHSIKKNAYIRGWNEKGMVFHLNNYYEKQWGPFDSDDFVKAQDAFMRSLAGYSIACYILQIKDRHNGNILVDEDGHLIHIDFGFMLSNSPGSVGFEMASFKLPQEYIDILGGVHGEKFAEYKALMKAAFLSVRKHSENILLLVEMMCKDSKLACFQSGEQTIQQLRDRFQLHLTEPQAEEFVDRMIMSSCGNVFTKLYDTYQYYSQGIL
ncbi:unnamed protein product [Absidia cylindrospora]